MPLPDLLPEGAKVLNRWRETLRGFLPPTASPNHYLATWGIGNEFGHTIELFDELPSTALPAEYRNGHRFRVILEERGCSSTGTMYDETTSSIADIEEEQPLPVTLNREPHARKYRAALYKALGILQRDYAFSYCLAIIRFTDRGGTTTLCPALLIKTADELPEQVIEDAFQGLLPEMVWEELECDGQLPTELKVAIIPAPNVVSKPIIEPGMRQEVQDFFSWKSFAPGFNLLRKQEPSLWKWIEQALSGESVWYS
ncbi:hypothetical protein DL767_006605 [Monosporascus sp. MG133]|nr:hypothetical protein DL767_006605 [Monosporascus sp. MG133]